MNESALEIEDSLPLGDYFTRGIRFHELARAVAKAQPPNLLVIGCGNGYLESLLPDSITALSLDIDARSLEVARRLNRGKANREFMLLNLYDIPQVVKASSFDGIVISEVIEHLDDDLMALRIAYECLKPQGVLFLTVPNVWRFQNRWRKVLHIRPQFMSSDHRREYTLQDIVRLVQQAGFSCEQATGLDFWFPKDAAFRFIVPWGSPLRRALGTRLPNLATWYLLTCIKKTERV